MSTSHACGLEEDGMPKERYQRYHEEKAKGGLALTMFGGSSICRNGHRDRELKTRIGDSELTAAALASLQGLSIAQFTWVSSRDAVPNGGVRVRRRRGGRPRTQPELSPPR